jgi:hypothetical protein
MTKREWNEKRFTEVEIIEMWAEFCFIEEAYGRMKKPDSKS